MSKNIYLIVFVTICLLTDSYSQSDSYIVKPVSFSSRLSNEFSPVFYKEGIVFCSDESDNSLVSYRDDQNRLFKIFYVTRKGSEGWSHSKILAKEITSAFNDGPVTFNEKGTIIYYSRNNSIKNSLRNISDSSNKLGIYSAELIDGIWTNIKPFTYNNPLYSFCTPSLTPDGERIYFSSDMPGGNGKMDLYYCDRKSNDWDQPVNLGSIINTSENESFPFACKYNKIYFASDGHEGYGGKDLFYTQEINGEWITPVHLDSAINSSADDFGLVIDSTSQNGYFSTNRRKTDDIFSFSSAPIEFTDCKTIKENNYCFTLYDEKQELFDTVPVIYKWDFGNGIIRIGKEVKHCFPGPGQYIVRLSIIDELTGDSLAKEVEYKVELENIEQAYINSSNFGIANQSITFDGVTADLKGFSITDYYWNFGDGFKPGGPLMSTSFKKKGNYMVQLGLFAEKEGLGVTSKNCVTKEIRIYNNYQDLVLKSESDYYKENIKTDSAGEKCKTLQARIHFMDDMSERQKTKIKEALKVSRKVTVTFNQYGIKSSSDHLLDKVADVLKENPDIRLELVLNTSENEAQDREMTLSEELARELTFYFKNKQVDMNGLHCKSFDLSDPLFKPFKSDIKTVDGVIELMFMKY